MRREIATVDASGSAVRIAGIPCLDTAFERRPREVTSS